MSSHRFVLLLGSGTDHEDRLEEACVRLQRLGDILSQSVRVHARSVLPEEAHSYVNQALLIETAMAREVLSIELKSLEAALGRRAGDGVCVIDIDLVCECDGEGAVLWRNPEKLEHALFRELVAQVLSGE